MIFCLAWNLSCLCTLFPEETVWAAPASLVSLKAIIAEFDAPSAAQLPAVTLPRAVSEDVSVNGESVASSSSPSRESPDRGDSPGADRRWYSIELAINQSIEG